MARSQAQQMFIFLTTIIVIGVLFLYGISSILRFFDLTEKYCIHQLKTDIEDSFEKQKKEYQSYQIYDFYMCKETKRVCFAGSFDPQAGLCKIGHPDYDPIICDAWEGGESIFFDPSFDTSIDVDSIRTSQSYICINVTNGKISVKLRGLGDAVEVQPA